MHRMSDAWKAKVVPITCRGCKHRPHKVKGKALATCIRLVSVFYDRANKTYVCPLYERPTRSSSSLRVRGQEQES
uniref:Uncharacterized protein n=1 Tax=viral metagenome TaxID=1070528 RepID=A0A6M3L7K9_9ZZZZ